MADLPVAGIETKEVALTLEQRVEILERDIKEVARGVNVQGSLLQAIVHASDHIVKKYIELTRIPDETKKENPKI